MTMMQMNSPIDFVIDDRIRSSTLWVCDFPLCQLLRQNDARYAWFVLVPRLADVTELYTTTPEQQNQIMLEVSLVSRFLKDVLGVHKINIGALGNIVPQLHIHVIGREVNDAAWPGPVWGVGAAAPFLKGADDLVERMRAWLDSCISCH